MKVHVNPPAVVLCPDTRFLEPRSTGDTVGRHSLLKPNKTDHSDIIAKHANMRLNNRRIDRQPMGYIVEIKLVKLHTRHQMAPTLGFKCGHRRIAEFFIRVPITLRDTFEQLMRKFD